MTTYANWARRGALRALALGATISIGVTVAGAASAAPAQGTLGTSSTRTVVRGVDVDGDGRRDAVRVTYSTVREGATISVRTAKKASATLRVQTAIQEQGGGSPWVGSASVDGRRGSELVLFTGLGDATHYNVYTWRDGRLTELRAPDDATGNAGWVVAAGVEGLGWQGYSFGTSAGARTVTHWNLPTKTASGRWYGTATRYHWSTRGWVKDSTVTKSVTTSAARDACLLGGLIVAR